MASIDSNKAELDIFKSQFTAFQNATKKPSELTNSQKVELIDALFPSGVALHYQNSSVAIGSLVYGEGNANINGGGFFFGEALSLPIATDVNVQLKYAI